MSLQESQQKARATIGPVPALRTVRVTRYVTPLREGGSLPAIVEADDDGTYVRNARTRGSIRLRERSPLDDGRPIVSKYAELTPRWVAPAVVSVVERPSI